MCSYSWNNEGLGLIWWQPASAVQFTCSPGARVGFLWVRQLPATCQEHALQVHLWLRFLLVGWVNLLCVQKQPGNSFPVVVSHVTHITYLQMRILSVFLMTCNIKVLCACASRLLHWAELSAGWVLKKERFVMCGSSNLISSCDVCFLCSVPISS